MKQAVQPSVRFSLVDGDIKTINRLRKFKLHSIEIIDDVYHWLPERQLDTDEKRRAYALGKYPDGRFLIKKYSVSTKSKAR